MSINTWRAVRFFAARVPNEFCIEFKTVNRQQKGLSSSFALVTKLLICQQIKAIFFASSLISET